MTIEVFRQALGRDIRYLKPYIIAEIGVNHEGSLDRAYALIEKAAESGCHAAKFQTYKAATLASESSPAYWDTTKEPTPTQFRLFQKYDAFGEREYGLLADHCAKCGIDFLSTPFDLPSVAFLAPLMGVFKIASADITNVPLLRKVAQTGKPVILSTGASQLSEVQTAVDLLTAAGCSAIALLHCVLNYPTDEGDANLGIIRTLSGVFPECVVGYSDHVPPAADGRMRSVEMAATLGALIIEKHFTDDKTLPGNDHYHAMDGSDAAGLNLELARLAALYGSEEKNVVKEAAARRHARRGIYATRNIPEGSIVTEDDIIPKRPVGGIGAQHWDIVVGSRTLRDIDSGGAVEWRALETKVE